MTVWSYRKTTKSTKPINQFEYIGFSAFWGIILIILYDLLTKIKEPSTDLLSNPFATGFCLSLIGIGLGYLGGSIILFFKKYKN